MFGTKTLAEIKKELIARHGYLPDFSAMRSLPPEEMPAPTNEIERKLCSLLAELERLVEQDAKTSTRRKPDGEP